MPKISDEARAARRMEILNAAWRCFHRQGLHMTVMDDIIRECGLSAGAVYGYFRNKDELILSALATSMSALAAEISIAFDKEPVSSPAELVAEVTGIIERFAVRDGYDLRRIALLGWAEAQRSETVRVALHGYYSGFRERLQRLAERWKVSGDVGPDADCRAVARTLLSLIMGYVAQQAIVGDVGPGDMARGLSGLVQ